MLLDTQQISTATAFEAFSNSLSEAEAAKVDALIGRIIDGRYRLDSKLGTGDMGAVYRATRLLIGDEVAIKILHQDHVTRDLLTAERFRREAQAAARLKHPNAVSIYDFGISTDGLQYLVMELIEGRNLRALIKQFGPLDSVTVSEITSQICAALDEAHRQHIVHRDVKPDNIIVNTAHGGLRVKVLDFGIAKLRDQVASNLTQTGSVVGTPHYMSPEQCLGEELDSRADVYSLGIVLYEMLCGVVPFNSPISTAVVVQHVNQKPPQMRAKNPGITPEVEAVVLHALEKSREARPQTAGALAKELAEAIHRQVVGNVPTQASFGIRASTHDSETHFYDDEITVVRDAAVSTPVAGSVTAGMSPTVHLAKHPGMGVATESTGNSSSFGRAGSKFKLSRKYTPFMIGVALAIIVAVGAFGTLAWLRQVKTDRNDITQAGEKAVGQAVKEIKPPSGMAYVPGGDFLMGSNDGDLLERPQHSVTVKPFFIDLYEVTCEEYEKFIKATNRRPPLGWKNGTYPSGAARRPVTGVDWDDANDYARWAGKRLPTEEEWEFAARGSDGRRYPWGNEWNAGATNAEKHWADRTAETDVVALEYLMNVGAHQDGKSPFGIFDMVGNAWEWTATDLKLYDGSPLPEKLADDESVIRGKVIRGGCYRNGRDTATTTFRRGWPAKDAATYKNTGFRCASDVTN